MLAEATVLLITAVPTVAQSVTHHVDGKKVSTDTAGLVTPVRAVPGPVTPGDQGHTLAQGGTLELLLTALHLMVVELYPDPGLGGVQTCDHLVRDLSQLNTGAIEQPDTASDISPVQTVHLEVTDPAGEDTLTAPALQPGTLQAGGAGTQLAGHDVVYPGEIVGQSHVHPGLISPRTPIPVRDDSAQVPVVLIVPTVERSS